MPTAGKSPRGSKPRGVSIPEDEEEYQESALPRRPSEEHKSRLTTAYKGRRRLQLISDIAMAEFTDDELATMYSVKRTDIMRFRDEFVQEVTEVRSALAGKLSIETAGLWISKKQNRMAEYQAAVETVDELIENDPLITTRRYAALMRLKVTYLRAAADEMELRGKDRSRDDDSGKSVSYKIDLGGLEEKLR